MPKNRAKADMPFDLASTASPDRGPAIAAPGVEGATLARTRVSLGLSLENGPGGRTLGVGEEPAGHTYRWPPISPSQERDLSVAYTALTGRRVWRSVLAPLILSARLHGPDTVSLLRELYQDDGVQDLLKRLIAYPPRLAPHPDYAISTEVPSEPARPADLPTVAPAQAVREQRADHAGRRVPPHAPQSKQRTPGGLTPIATLLRPPADAPSLRREPVSAPHQHFRRAELVVRDPECRPPSALGSLPADPPQVRRPRPPACPYDRHEPTWYQRPDGTWNCRTCHP